MNRVELVKVELIKQIIDVDPERDPIRQLRLGADVNKEEARRDEERSRRILAETL